MGSCAGKGGSSNLNVYQTAQKIFYKLDLNKQNFLDAKAIQKYFPEYGATATKIFMREMDLNQDGIITKAEWFGYWEYIRRAGYSNSQILNTLNKIKKKQLNLEFANAKDYQRLQPRVTLIDNIITQMKKDQTFPIILQQK